MAGLSRHDITAVGSSDTELFTVKPHSASGRATLFLDNPSGGAALTDLRFYILDKQEKEWEVEITDEDYITGYEAGITTLAAGSTAAMKFDMRGVHEIKVTAKTGSTTNLYWSWEE